MVVCAGHDTVDRNYYWEKSPLKKRSGCAGESRVPCAADLCSVGDRFEHPQQENATHRRNAIKGQAGSSTPVEAGVLCTTASWTCCFFSAHRHRGLLGGGGLDDVTSLPHTLRHSLSLHFMLQTIASVRVIPQLRQGHPQLGEGVWGEEGGGGGGSALKREGRCWRESCTKGNRSGAGGGIESVCLVCIITAQLIRFRTGTFALRLKKKPRLKADDFTSLPRYGTTHSPPHTLSHTHTHTSLHAAENRISARHPTAIAKRPASA